ncbi:RagB/SusD family nutrient uptake outer membrane protein [Mucilaginibacter aquaedulcis]|uniref:RagB/SusD family nutrient uptake outer membrane protein n=1 Tax=Mucilaginibacter aquaedulcis TaxID=1187081 RepID=UPI0025B37233|nr:RagB/SusD family nutrient uptake outer membrane protein [Mucilaginibacter aquaedulcis]MDN3550458.1 RagB/SusD family nutrient uptake outer membrane protein [Mucilaginibacter aquaedulcis]
MKRNRSLIFTMSMIAMGSVIVSCKKLEKNVYNDVPTSNFYQTPAQIAAGVAPVYTALTPLQTEGVFQANEASSDEMIVPTRGGDWFDGGKWQALWKHSFTADVLTFNDAWGNLSAGISKANFILNILNGLPTKPANIDNINAEVKVMRDYYLFYLMDMYGNVPLVTDFNTDPSKVTTVARKDVYTFLINDLKANVPLLSVKAASNYGHMTRHGGFMLLAKLYLNAQVYTGTADWANASAAADSVISSGLYSLQPSFLDNFAVVNEGSVENIFVIPFDKVNITGNQIEAYSLNYNSQFTFDLLGQPYNGFSAPRAFYTSFTDADARKKMFIVGQQYSSAGAPLTDKGTGLKVFLSPYINELSNPADSFKFAGARSIKYAPEAGSFPNSSNDGVRFRLGDAYLMKAEADMHLGNTNTALTLVNAIRRRAGVPEWTSADLTFDNLLAERGREMAWEGWRRNDLIRFEVATGTKYWTGARLPGKTQDPDTHTFIFPIPNLQIIANPLLKQNPGY